MCSQIFLTTSIRVLSWTPRNFLNAGDTGTGFRKPTFGGVAAAAAGGAGAATFVTTLAAAASFAPPLAAAMSTLQLPRTLDMASAAAAFLSLGIEAATMPFGFPILAEMSRYDVETVSEIVLACCILHNFLVDFDPDEEIIAQVDRDLMNNEPDHGLANGAIARGEDG
ncbi:hypothetical protein ZIOFF_068579 [Zingiber officinale]|uniref:Nuclease HARBI1 n=1 Tax=Zingiber officinale TaxID=94328 RepID=A0A8J5CEZ9_ZINOF|nr:hypothetical protein ZIOFF_068579 [Zingiber officinale]